MDMPIHPVVVHTPIALIITSLLFDIIGRATDLAWWRKAAFAMLVVGVIGAWGAVWTGNASEEAVEEQGVPHEVIEAHESAGIFTQWMGTIAVVGRLLETRPGAARGLVSIAALLAHLLAATGAGLAGFRGGILVYEHGAGVEMTSDVAGGHEDADNDEAARPSP